MQASGTERVRNTANSSGTERVRNTGVSLREQKHFDGIDCLKFVLSVGIVALHTDPTGLGWEQSWLYPWLRLAVPLFFVISAFFFFKKWNTLPTRAEAERAASESRQPVAKFTRESYRRKFAIRNLQLYGFWLLVLSVPTLYIRRYFDAGIVQGLLTLVQNFFFGSTFVASWYIMATVIGVCLVTVFFANRPKLMMGVALVAYALACATSNYAGLLAQVPGWTELQPMLYNTLGYPYNNFVVGFAWVALGKCLADRIDAIDRLPLFGVGALAVVGCVGLLLEHVLVGWLGSAVANDCYLLLTVPTVGLFLLVLKTPATIPWAAWGRTASTITYCFHGTLCWFLYRFAFTNPATDSLLLFGVTLVTSWLVTGLICAIERFRPFAWLKYSH